jgi:4-hydroxy-2-oxoglutarate aldolase
MDKRLQGVFAPITTPFDDNGGLDLSGLKSNMGFYASSGLHGYLALGSNGENKSLMTDEKLAVLETIVRGKHPDQVVMAGSIFESTFETIRFARQCQAIGADFITLLPPSYFKKQMTDEALFRYFTDVADQVSIPCLVYNAPQFCGGTTLSVDLVARLAGHPNIVGVKDSSTGANIVQYLHAVKDRFHVVAGSANFFLEAMLEGATGGVISLANVFPRFVLDLYELMVSRDDMAAFAVNEKVLRVNQAVSGQGGVAAVKKAMDLAGLVGGLPRLPLLPLPADAAAVLEAALRTEGLI